MVAVGGQVQKSTNWVSIMNQVVSFRSILILTIGVCALAALYIFQRINYGLLISSAVGVDSPTENGIFILNKTIRLLVNDAICTAMIFSVFKEKSYRQFTAVVFLIELMVVLPVYLVLKLTLEGTSELSTPLLSFIHRLVVNPTLMLLTGIALAYQKFVYHPSKKA